MWFWKVADELIHSFASRFWVWTRLLYVADDLFITTTEEPPVTSPVSDAGKVWTREWSLQDEEICGLESPLYPWEVAAVLLPESWFMWAWNCWLKSILVICSLQLAGIPWEPALPAGDTAGWQLQQQNKTGCFSMQLKYRWAVSLQGENKPLKPVYAAVKTTAPFPHPFPQNFIKTRAGLEVNSWLGVQISI